MTVKADWQIVRNWTSIHFLGWKKNKVQRNLKCWNKKKMNIFHTQKIGHSTSDLLQRSINVKLSSGSLQFLLPIRGVLARLVMDDTILHFLQLFLTEQLWATNWETIIKRDLYNKSWWTKHSQEGVGEEGVIVGGGPLVQRHWNTAAIYPLPVHHADSPLCIPLRAKPTRTKDVSEQDK